MFGAPPFNPEQDPFGMGDFNNMDLENAIGEIDKRITEMRVMLILLKGRPKQIKPSASQKERHCVVPDFMNVRSGIECRTL